MMDLDKYKEISGDVWKLFKDKHEEVISWEDFWVRTDELDGKYHGKPGYEFMQQLLKVYFNELRGKAYGKNG